MKKLYTLGLYEKALPIDLSWEEKLKVAKESGYDFLEMSIDETEEKMARLDMSEILYSEEGRFTDSLTLLKLSSKISIWQ